MKTIPEPVNNNSAKRKLQAELAIPSLLLVAFALAVWLSAFVGNESGPVPSVDASALQARAAGQISGVEAAVKAIRLAQDAVENRSPGDDGLLAGDLESVRVRYKPLGTASSWTVVIQAPVRTRPNTDGEFRVDDGMIVIELSVFTGEVSGLFSAGRAFSNPAGGSGFLNTLGISPDGLFEVSLDQIWPPVRP